VQRGSNDLVRKEHDNVLALSRPDSPSSQPGQATTTRSQGHVTSRPTPPSSTCSLHIPTSSSDSHGSSRNGRRSISGVFNSSQEVVYTLGNPSSESATAVYANSNPDSDHSNDDFEYRQPAGVYAMSNPDSELSHDEYEYDPRFEFPPVISIRGVVAGEGGGTYPISNPDSEVSLEDFEQYPYDPSLDGMQLY
jgi:hypothetical protein